MDDFSVNDFEGDDFEGDDFEGDDFEGDDFEGDDFEGDDFEGDDFEGDDFEGDDFEGDDFEGDDFEGDDFEGDDFEGDDFEGDDFEGDDFEGDDFEGDDFDGDNFDDEDSNDESISEGEEAEPVIVELVSEDLAEESESINEVETEAQGDNEDICYTPAEDSSLGEWRGERGNSLFIPSDPEAQRILEALGVEGIPYTNGEPDFRDITIATVFLTEDEMNDMGDAAQKQYMANTLADDIHEEDDDDFDEIDEEANDDFEDIQVIDWDLVETVFGDDEDFIAAIRSGEIPQGLVGHHGSQNADGTYNYQLIPSVLHKVFIHRGGRSKSGTHR